MPRRCERERDGESLSGEAGRRATPELPATSGTTHPRYRMTEMPALRGITRVVP